MIKYSIKRLIQQPSLAAKHYLKDDKLLEIFWQAIVETSERKNQEPTCLIILLIHHRRARHPLINLIKAIFNQTAKETLKHPIFKQDIPIGVARKQL